MNEQKFSGSHTNIYSDFRTLLLTLLVILFTVGCAGPTGGNITSRADMTLPTAGPTAAPSPVNTRVMPVDLLTPAPTATITPIPDEVRGLVINVMSGDTIAVVMDGDPMRLAYTVRYIGVDAPTLGEPWGSVSREANEALVGVKVVRLVRDQTDFDEDGNLLRYVYLDDQLINQAIVARGLAEVEEGDENTRLLDLLTTAAENAQGEQLGLWGPSTPTATPGRAAAATVTPTATSEESENDEEADTDTDEADTTATPSLSITVEATDSTATVTRTVTPNATSTATPSPTATSIGSNDEPDEADSNADDDELLGPSN